MRDNSYANNKGSHYVRGHYSRDRYGRNGGYSRDSVKDRMADKLEELLSHTSSQKEKELIRSCLDQLDDM